MGGTGGTPKTNLVSPAYAGTETDNYTFSSVAAAIQSNNRAIEHKH